MKKIALVSLLIALLFVTVANAQKLPTEPTLGQKIKVRIPVSRIDVKWNKSKNINNVYSAGSGWQILEFVPIVVSKRQYAAYTFSQVPSNYSLDSTSIVDKKFDELLDIAVQNGKKEKYEARIKQLRNDYEKYYKKIVASNSSIQTTGSVQGDNNTFKRRPGRLYLDLEVTLVYAPENDKQFQQAIEFLKTMIKNDTLQQ